MQYKERKIRRGKMDINPPLNVEKVDEKKSNTKLINHPWGAETPVETPPEKAFPATGTPNPLLNLFKKLVK